MSFLSPMFARLSSTLALLAMLQVVGLQVLEAGHVHSSDQAKIECLQCKNSADLSVSSLPSMAAPALHWQHFPVESVAPQQQRLWPAPLARGPPAHS